MRHSALLLVYVSLGSVASAALALPPSAAVTPSTIPRLSLAEESVLAELIEQHRRVRARFSAEDRALLDRLTALVKERLFAAPLRDDLLGAAARSVSQIIPELAAVEAGSLAEYALLGIASDTSLSPTVAELQMGFNEKLIQVQMAMQRENTMFSSVSNVLKTRHDTVKNSIGNIR